jgi:hypothetical protein
MKSGNPIVLLPHPTEALHLYLERETKMGTRASSASAVEALATAVKISERCNWKTTEAD